MSKWDGMTPRERDALVSEVLMNRPCVRCDYYMGVHTIAREFLDEGDYSFYIEGEGHYRVADYTTDLTAARLVEDAIERRGEDTREAYIYKLTDVLAIGNGWRYEGPSGRELWALIRATPEQRCRAALHAVGVEI